jgi:hypothetical protein
VTPTPAAADIRLILPEGSTTRALPVSRDFRRVPLQPDLTPKGHRFTKTKVVLRTDPSNKARSAGKLRRGTKVRITGNTAPRWRMIVWRGKGVWVPSRLLSVKKPVLIAALSTRPCASGSAMERGLTGDAIRVHRALCARYPQVTSYGGMRADSASYHSSGRAVDAMISNQQVGWDMARWLRANARRLGISEIIYAQRIWTVQRGGEGWRPMGDRGSVSANHFDHVHISVFGSAATG